MTKNQKQRSKEENIKYSVMVAVVVVILLLLAFPLRKYFFSSTQVPSDPNISTSDPLCRYVANSWGLHCVVAFAADGVLGPGHYVAYDLLSATPPKVPFPNGSLFAASCLVPGAEASGLLTDLENQEKSHEIKFDNVIYKLDRHFTVGTELPIPKLANFVIKAGPKLSEVQSVTINAPHAWLEMVDENQFIELLAHAGIRENCIKNLIDRKYSVISKAAIAKDFDITLTDTSGRSVGLSAGANKGQINIDAGGDAGSNVAQTISRASANPLVVAVDFFNPDIFAQNQARLTGPVFSSTGETHAKVSASPANSNGWQREHSGPIDQPLNIQDQGGGGGGPCGGGAPASAQLSTRVIVEAPTAKTIDTPPSQPFEFVADGFLVGGAARTVPFCSQQQGNVQAEISFDTTVKTLVRADHASTLIVSLPGVENPTVEAFTWDGNKLMEKSGAANNEVRFALSGPGVYTTHISGRRTFFSSGASPKPIHEKKPFAISVR